VLAGAGDPRETQGLQLARHGARPWRDTAATNGSGSAGMYIVQLRRDTSSVPVRRERFQEGLPYSTPPSYTVYPSTPSTLYSTPLSGGGVDW
jgi:hypothetical protein